jgi:flagellar hook-associated protein 1
MADLLGIGASGVRAYQTALGVVGGNIANATTPGYTRRDVRMNETSAATATTIFGTDRAVSGGVTIGGVTRAWDSFRAAAMRTASADVASSETSVTYLARVEQALGGSGIGTNLTAFFNKAKALAADPTGTAPRIAYLSAAAGTADAFNATAASLGAIADDLDADTRNTVTSLNGLTANLAKVNLAMASARPGTSAAASIADQRDQIIDQISSLAAIDVSYDARGVATVRLNQANGPMLVSGGSAGLVAAETSGTGLTTFTLAFGGKSEQLAVSGGALAGLADASLRVADARGALDGIANSFAAAVNANQAQGVDLAGKPGAAMFAAGYATTSTIPGSSGAASISASVAPGASPFAGGYTAVWQPMTGDWKLARTDGSSAVSGTGTLVLDGVSVTLGGAPEAGDGFNVDVGSGAAGLTFVGIQPSQAAAAGRWTVDAPITNTGTGSVTVVPSSASGLPALGSYALNYANGIVTITDPANGQVLASQAYEAGMAIAGAGFTLTLAGQMKDGDSFSLTPTRANSRDNGNLLALESARGSGEFEAGVESITQRNAATLAARQSLAQAQGAIRDNAVAARDEQSGVNLDEEAVALMKYQQAYQASSRIIQMARETFQNILDVV